MVARGVRLRDGETAEGLKDVFASRLKGLVEGIEFTVWDSPRVDAEAAVLADWGWEEQSGWVEGDLAKQDGATGA